MNEERFKIDNNLYSESRMTGNCGWSQCTEKGIRVLFLKEDFYEPFCVKHADECIKKGYVYDRKKN